MSAVGNVQSAAAGPEVADDDEEAPGLWGSFGAALRLIVGWFSVAIAVLNLLAEVDRNDREPDHAYLVFHAMLLVGGLLLIALGSFGSAAGVLGRLAGGLVLAAGMVISALPDGRAACCLTAFDVRHGYPFSFVAHDTGARWHVDSQHLLADLLFWGYAGLIVLALVAGVRRVTGHHAGDRE